MGILQSLKSALKRAMTPTIEIQKRDRWQGLHRKSHFSKTQQRRGLTSRYPLHQGKKEIARRAETRDA
jgi:hypothetical protein